MHLLVASQVLNIRESHAMVIEGGFNGHLCMGLAIDLNENYLNFPLHNSRRNYLKFKEIQIWPLTSKLLFVLWRKGKKTYSFIVHYVIIILLYNSHGSSRAELHGVYKVRFNKKKCLTNIYKCHSHTIERKRQRQGRTERRRNIRETLVPKQTYTDEHWLETESFFENGDVTDRYACMNNHIWLTRNCKNQITLTVSVVHAL